MDEISVYEKYGLYWHGSQAVNNLGECIADGTYIYQPERFLECFWLLFDRLGQINDYCLNQLIASETKLNTYRSQKQDIENEVIDVMCASELDFLDDSLQVWTHNVDIVAKTIPLILLSSFIEWGLKRILIELSVVVPKIAKSSEPLINQYIEQIVSQFLPSLKIDEQILSTVATFRKARNAFAHGSWDVLETILLNVNLRSCFSSVSDLFKEIELQYWLVEKP